MYKMGDRLGRAGKAPRGTSFPRGKKKEGQKGSDRHLLGEKNQKQTSNNGPVDVERHNSVHVPLFLHPSKSSPPKASTYDESCLSHVFYQVQGQSEDTDPLQPWCQQGWLRSQEKVSWFRSLRCTSTVAQRPCPCQMKPRGLVPRGS